MERDAEVNRGVAGLYVMSSGTGDVKSGGF